MLADVQLANVSTMFIKDNDKKACCVCDVIFFVGHKKCIGAIIFTVSRIKTIGAEI